MMLWTFFAIANIKDVSRTEINLENEYHFYILKQLLHFEILNELPSILSTEFDVIRTRLRFNSVHIRFC
jgi:hypothetical protein